MASKNRTFSMTKGAYGTQMGFNLYDALGKFTITGTVKIFAKLQGGSVNAINGANCNVAGPFTIEGTAYDGKYAFTNLEMDLPAGKYLFRFEHTSGGVVQYFPTDPTEYYGKIIINPSPV
jgi:hypothetical protein